MGRQDRCGLDRARTRRQTTTSNASVTTPPITGGSQVDVLLT
jgi:hypothetical protein